MATPRSARRASRIRRTARAFGRLAAWGVGVIVTAALVRMQLEEIGPIGVAFLLLFTTIAIVLVTSGPRGGAA